MGICIHRHSCHIATSDSTGAFLACRWRNAVFRKKVFVGNDRWTTHPILDPGISGGTLRAENAAVFDRARIRGVGSYAGADSSGGGGLPFVLKQKRKKEQEQEEGPEIWILM